MCAGPIIDHVSANPSMSGSNIEALRITVGELTFHVLACGPVDGTPVMLLHGFPQNATTWVPLLERLGAAGYRAVAPTQRGYSPGARPADRSAYALDHLTGDVLGIATALGMRRFDLVGHDWGGVVGWALASGSPDRVQTYTSLSMPHPAAYIRALAGRQGVRSLYAAFFQLPVVPELVLGAADGVVLRRSLEVTGLSPTDAARYVSVLDAASRHAALQWYRATDPRTLAALGPAVVPTLYVWGRNDAALGRVAAEATADHVTAPYRFEELDASHWLPEECPDVVGALIESHLSEHARHP